MNKYLRTFFTSNISMRKFIDIAAQLNEARKDEYPSMFAKFLAALIGPNVPRQSTEAFIDMVNREIEWAKQTLKRHDRIIWYLTYKRKEWCDRFFDRTTSEEGHNYFKKMMDYPKDSEIPSPRRLNHFTDMFDKVPAMDRIVWTGKTVKQLTVEMDTIEKEWAAKRSGTIPLNDEDRPIMTFPDGFEWVKLDRGGCRVEGDAMGHCGNGTGYGSHFIYSLRSRVVVDGETLWRPSLTFIVAIKDGKLTLGEMKGRGNTKPSNKYHHHIVALLKSEHVDAIDGGGYLPENNFSLDDLNESIAKDIAHTKPSLCNIGQIIKWNPEVFYRNPTEFIKFRGAKYNISGETIEIITKYDYVENFFAETPEYNLDGYRSDNCANWAGGIIAGTEHFDAEGDIDDHWEEILKTEDIPDVVAWYKEHMPDELEEFYEEEDIDELTTTQELWDLLDRNRCAWYDAAQNGAWAGAQSGTEGDMSEAISTGSIRWCLNEDNMSYEKIVLVPNSNYSSEPFTYQIPLKDFIAHYVEAASHGNEFYFEEKVYVEQPRYGFVGYNSKSGRDTFDEEKPTL